MGGTSPPPFPPGYATVSYSDLHYLFCFIVPSNVIQKYCNGLELRALLIEREAQINTTVLYSIYLFLLVRYKINVPAGNGQAGKAPECRGAIFATYPYNSVIDSHTISLSSLLNHYKRRSNLIVE